MGFDFPACFFPPHSTPGPEVPASTFSPRRTPAAPDASPFPGLPLRLLPRLAPVRPGGAHLLPHRGPRARSACRWRATALPSGTVAGLDPHSGLRLPRQFLIQQATAATALAATRPGRFHLAPCCSHRV